MSVVCEYATAESDTQGYSELSPVNCRSPPPPLEIDIDWTEEDSELLGSPVDEASVAHHKAQDADKKPDAAVMGNRLN